MDPRHSARLVGLLLLLAPLRSPAAEDDPAGKVRAFQAKVASATAAQDSQARPHRSHTAAALKQLSALLSRGDFEKARQMLANLQAYDLPPELQQEWADLTASLGPEMEKMESKALEEWRTQVDQLVTEVRQSCLAAKTAADLDPLLVRASALQMQRSGQNNVLGQRASRKLAGIGGTLENWANFLDFRNAGNAKAANDILRGLITNQSQFPVLTVPEIEAELLKDENKKLTPRGALQEVFNGVKTPDDIPAALQRLEVLHRMQKSGEPDLLPYEKQRLEAFQTAWEAVKNGDEQAATRAVNRAAGSGTPEAEPFYEPLREQILRSALAERIKTLTGITARPDENTASFLARAVEHFREKGDYAGMLESLKLLENFPQSPLRSETSYLDRAAIERFILAQRFETAGDVVAAVNAYRYVVGSNGGKHAPIQQATEALQRLGKQHPEALKSYEGIVLEEIRSLRQQILILNRPGQGRPFGN